MGSTEQAARRLPQAAAALDVRDAAVIDLGSNSWRLVTYRYAPGGWWRRTGQMQEPVRIAHGLAASGKLGRAAVRRGLATLEVFSAYCQARGIAPADVDVVATSAVRDAANRDDLIVPATERTGFGVRVLTAEEEARYGYLAAVNSTTLTDGTVLDLGGGSLQLVAVGDREARDLASWPLGAVRVTDRLLPGSGAVGRKQLKRARAAIAADLAGAPWLGTGGRRLVGIGGAVRNLASAAQRAERGEAGQVQGFVLQAGDLHRLVGELARLPAGARALPGIKPARADIILGAVLVLEAVMKAGDFTGIEVTRAGLREGVFFERRLLADGRPLIADVRRSSVRDFAVRCQADLVHAGRVASLALQLHDSLAHTGVARLEPEERELLWAAAMLHDVGMPIGHDGNHARSQHLISSAALPGYAPEEMARVAQIVRHRRKLAPGVEPLVQRAALLLRLAELLDAGEDGAVETARLAADRRALRLDLRGDTRLARWSIERQLDDGAFRRVFGRPLVAG